MNDGTSLTKVSSPSILQPNLLGDALLSPPAVATAISADQEYTPSSRTQTNESNSSNLESNLDSEDGENIQPPTIPISITHQDASQILEASQMFSETLTQLQLEEKQRSKQQVEDNLQITSSENANNQIDRGGGNNTSKIKQEDRSMSNDETSVPPSAPKPAPDQMVEGKEPVAMDKNKTEYDVKSVNHLLIEAARKCSNSLLSSFLKEVESRGKTESEIKLYLLLFVKMKKSTKLTGAFENVVSDLQQQQQQITQPKSSSNQTEEISKNTGNSDDPLAKSGTKRKREIKQEDNGDGRPLKMERSEADKVSIPQHMEVLEDTSKVNEDEKTESDLNGSSYPNVEKRLRLADVTMIFSCFLGSISLSLSIAQEPDDRLEKPFTATENIQPPKVSPQGKDAVPKELKLSNLSQKDINTTATFAAKSLFSHFKQRNSATAGVTFEDFGDWYNSGGFQIMPWLELLDLAKWAPLGKRTEEPQDANNNSTSEQHNGKESGQTGTAQSSSSAQDVKETPSKPVPTTDTTKSNSQDVTSGKSSSPGARKSAGDSVVPILPKGNTGTPSQENNLGFPKTPQQPPDPNNRNPPTSKSQNRPPTSSTPLPENRRIVSFDFRDSLPDYLIRPGQDFELRITEENLSLFKKLVETTGLSKKAPSELCDILLKKTSQHDQLKQSDFISSVREMAPSLVESGQFHEDELKTFSNFFLNFFACFDIKGIGVVNAKELAVGFTFLCSGSKSMKLAVSFDLMDVNHTGCISSSALTSYLRSYLLMLVGISFLSKSLSSKSKEEKRAQEKKRADMYVAVEHGSQWIHHHIMRYISGRNHHSHERYTRLGTRVGPTDITFDEFGEWYTEVGYRFVPWLELLDLSKFLPLLEKSEVSSSHTTVGGKLPPPPINTNHSPRSYQQNSMSKIEPYKISGQPDPSSHYPYAPFVNPFDTSAPPPHKPPNSHHHMPGYQSETLFTFPLAHEDNLIVQREDAMYVRSIVNQLTLLSYEPEGVWTSLVSSIRSYYSASAWDKEGPIMVNQSSFVHAMAYLVGRGKKVDDNITSTLENFYKSFDLRKENCVSLNQLMGGLTLLCGGRKSAKLAFAFGLFDYRKSQNSLKSSKSSQGKYNDKSAVSLDRDELHTFFRSFLIVLFSCCAQSLDLDAHKIGGYISDTAHMVCSNVMDHQWRKKHMERINFDEFGEWYNEGGYEIAPWLELLDLNKWVLLDKLGPPPVQPPHNSNPYYPGPNTYPMQSSHDHMSMKSSSSRANNMNMSQGNNRKREIDPFFDLPQKETPVQDDMAYLMSTVRDSKENNSNFPSNPRDSSSSTYNAHTHSSSHPPSHSSSGRTDDTPLKFNLLISDDRDGYVISVEHQRVSQLRYVVTETGLSKMNTTTACNCVLEYAYRQRSESSSDRQKESLIFRKEDLDRAVRSLVSRTTSHEAQRALSDIFISLFHAFDKDNKTFVDARDFVCGISILCGGKKIDKLEYAFELLDEDKDGKLSQQDVYKYLKSFLTVVLSLSSAGRTLNSGEPLLRINGEYDRTKTMLDAISAGAGWATNQVFQVPEEHPGGARRWKSSIVFDDFADWYTRGGYNCIPWLELLDLKKWVLVP